MRVRVHVGSLAGLAKPTATDPSGATDLGYILSDYVPVITPTLHYDFVYLQNGLSRRQIGRF